MKRIVIGMAAAMSLFATGALAADLAAKPYVKAPVMVDPVWNWTGFYIGGNIGYSWGRSRDDSSLTNTAGTVLFTSSDRANMDGVIGGAQIGYNWQVQNWVWGLEADIQGSDQKGSRSFVCPIAVCTPSALILVAPGPAVPVSLDQKLTWFGTVRGRVGILATPKVLFYGTGGLAFGEIKTSGAMTGFTAAGVPILALGSSSTTRAGWTAGVGVEGKITQNWSAKLEYLYMDLGRFNAGTYTLVPLSGISANVSSRFSDHILRAGINYQFGGPVVARY